MPSIQGLEWTFDTNASVYMKMRPDYPAALYRSVFEYYPINHDSQVVEVGIGGGQATPQILETGCTLTAIEYGAHLAELCREKFQKYPKFSVITDRFEHVNFEEEAYDLVFSASAFHWIPEEIGYQKVHTMLKKGGVFARFANHPYQDKGRPELSERMQELYSKYMPESKKPEEYKEQQAKERAEIALKYGFRDIRYEMFHRTRTFTAKEYIALLGTYSDHIAIEEGTRQSFFMEIEKVINDYGGVFTLYDTIDLQLARK